MSKNEVDDDDIEFDDDLDIDDVDDFDSDFDDEESERTPTQRAAGGFLRGARDAGLSRGVRRQMIEGALPKGYGSAHKELEDAWDTGKEVYETAAEKIRPVTKQMKKIGSKATDQAEGYLPESITNKLKEWTSDDDERDKRILEKTDHDKLEIQQAIQDTFGQQQAEQAEQQAEEQKADFSQKATEQAFEQTRHQSEISFLRSIAESVKRQVDFQDRITASYQRKQIELQYRQLFYMRDSYSHFQAHTSEVLSQLKSISHNTALPESTKYKGTEHLREILNERALDSLADYSTNFMGNLREKLKSKVGELGSQFAEGVGVTSDAMEQAEDMSEFVDPYEQTGETAGGIAASSGLPAFARQAGKKIGKIPGVRQFGEQLDYYSKEYPFLLRDYVQDAAAGRTSEKREEGSEEEEKREGWRGEIDRIRGATRRGLGQLETSLADFAVDLFPNFKADQSYQRDEIAETDQAIPFTKRTERAITEVIPGYLSQILQETTQIRTGRDDVERTSYDYAQGEFVGQSELGRRLTDRILPNDERERTRTGTEDIVKTLDPEGELDDDTRQALTRQLIEDVRQGRSFDPTRFAQGDNLDAVKDQDTAQRLSEQMRNLILDEHGQQSGDEIALQKRAKVTRKFQDLRQRIPDYQNKVQQLSHIYSPEELRQTGLLASTDKVGEQRLQGDSILSNLAGDRENLTDTRPPDTYGESFKREAANAGLDAELTSIQGVRQRAQQDPDLAGFQDNLESLARQFDPQVIEQRLQDLLDHFTSQRRSGQLGQISELLERIRDCVCPHRDEGSKIEEPFDPVPPSSGTDLPYSPVPPASGTSSRFRAQGTALRQQGINVGAQLKEQGDRAQEWTKRAWGLTRQGAERVQKTAQDTVPFSRATQPISGTQGTDLQDAQDLGETSPREAHSRSQRLTQSAAGIGQQTTALARDLKDRIRPNEQANTAGEQDSSQVGNLVSETGKKFTQASNYVREKGGTLRRQPPDAIRRFRQTNAEQEQEPSIDTGTIPQEDKVSVQSGFGSYLQQGRDWANRHLPQSGDQESLDQELSETPPAVRRFRNLVDEKAQESYRKARDLKGQIYPEKQAEAAEVDQDRTSPQQDDNLRGQLKGQGVRAQRWGRHAWGLTRQGAERVQKTAQDVVPFSGDAQPIPGTQGINLQDAQVLGQTTPIQAHSVSERLSRGAGKLKDQGHDFARRIYNRVQPDGQSETPESIIDDSAPISSLPMDSETAQVYSKPEMGFINRAKVKADSTQDWVREKARGIRGLVHQDTVSEKELGPTEKSEVTEKPTLTGYIKEIGTKGRDSVREGQKQVQSQGRKLSDTLRSTIGGEQSAINLQPALAQGLSVPFQPYDTFSERSVQGSGGSTPLTRSQTQSNNQVSMSESELGRPISDSSQDTQSSPSRLIERFTNQVREKTANVSNKTIQLPKAKSESKDTSNVSLFPKQSEEVQPITKQETEDDSSSVGKNRGRLRQFADTATHKGRQSAEFTRQISQRIHPNGQEEILDSSVDEQDQEDAQQEPSGSREGYHDKLEGKLHSFADRLQRITSGKQHPSDSAIPEDESKQRTPSQPPTGDQQMPGYIRQLINEITGHMDEKTNQITEHLGNLGTDDQDGPGIMGRVASGASQGAKGLLNYYGKMFSGMGKLGYGALAGGGKAASGIGGGIGDLASGVFGGIGQGFRGAGDLARGTSDKLRSVITGQDIEDVQKQRMDVYREGQAEPVLLARDLKAGRYYDQESGEPIYSFEDIQGPVIDSQGNIVISREDVENDSLYLSSGESLNQKTGLASKFGSAAKGYLNYTTMPSRMAFNIGKKVLKMGAEAIRGGPQDIYVVGEQRPRMLATIMENGGYISKATGEPITSIDDIDGDVVDKQGNVVLSLEDMRQGVVDNRGNRLSSLAEMAKKSLMGIASGIGKYYKGVFSLAGRGVGAAARGAGRLLGMGDKGQAEDSDQDQGEPGSDAQGPAAIDSQTTQAIDRIRELVGGIDEKSGRQIQALEDIQEQITQVSQYRRDQNDARFSAKDGQYRSGGWREQLSSEDEDVAASTAQQEENQDEVRWDKSDSLIPSMGDMWSFFSEKLGPFIKDTLGGLLGMLGLKKLLGGKGGDADGDKKRKRKPKKRPRSKGGKGGWLKKAGNFLKRNAGKVVSWGARAAMAIGSLISGFFTAPVLIGIGVAVAIGAAAYGGYKLYQHLSKEQMTPFDRFRLAQYGVSKDQEEGAAKILKLEEKLTGKVSFDKDSREVKFDDGSIDMDSIIEIFEISDNDEERKAKFMHWLENRFVPVLAMHSEVAKKMASTEDPRKVYGKLSASDRLKYLSKTHFNINDDSGPYSVLESPFVTISQLLTPQKVDNVYQNVRSEIEKNVEESSEGSDVKEPSEKTDKKSEKDSSQSSSTTTQFKDKRGRGTRTVSQKTIRMSADGDALDAQDPQGQSQGSSIRASGLIGGLRSPTGSARDTINRDLTGSGREVQVADQTGGDGDYQGDVSKQRQQAQVAELQQKEANIQSSKDISRVVDILRQQYQVQRSINERLGRIGESIGRIEKTKYDEIAELKAQGNWGSIPNPVTSGGSYGGGSNKLSNDSSSSSSDNSSASKPPKLNSSNAKPPVNLGRR